MAILFSQTRPIFSKLFSSTVRCRVKLCKGLGRTLSSNLNSAEYLQSKLLSVRFCPFVLAWLAAVGTECALLAPVIKCVFCCFLLTGACDCAALVVTAPSKHVGK